MMHYQRAGDVPAKPHTTFRDKAGALYYEQCFTRQGFDGPFSVLYHRHPPQGFSNGQSLDALWPVAREIDGGAQEPLRRRHLKSGEIQAGGTPTRARQALLFNDDITLGVLCPDQDDTFYFANGDGDDVFYIHQGGGELRSWFGALKFSQGDYVIVPRSVVHRFVLEDTKQHWFWTECRSGVRIPKQYLNPIGQLRMDAPYTHRDFRAPELSKDIDPEGDKRVISKRRDRFSGHVYDHAPLDTVGWDGTVYPFVLPILNFSPKAGQVHLPPTVHGTFATEGSLICSFVPRMVDFGEGAIPCPYPHSNVDVDEVIFYADGDFTSRRGIDAGSLSFHPAGVPHGPHPGAYEGSIGVKEVSELAVMIDTYEPLKETDFARDIEALDYDTTWK